MHDGWIYAPATSVALNRNFQIVHRAPIERAVKPAAWEVYQHGFPSKDRQDRGTINLAERDWDRPWTTRGFHLSGHEGPSLSVLRRNWATNQVSGNPWHEADVRVRRATWQWNAPRTGTIECY